MPVPIESVQAGKCFATPGQQVRRVLSVTAGRVTYEARGRQSRRGEWLWRNVVELDRFAYFVSREVPCDHGTVSGP